MTWIKSVTPAAVHNLFGLYSGQWMKEMDRCWIREEDGVCVCSRLLRTDWGKVEHVTITKSIGDSKDISWSDKQQIKDELFGKNRTAIEVFPAESNLVDVADVYHLWVFDKHFKLPFGIHPKEYQPAVNRGAMPLSPQEMQTLQKYYDEKGGDIFGQTN